MKINLVIVQKKVLVAIDRHWGTVHILPVLCLLDMGIVMTKENKCVYVGIERPKRSKY